MLNDELFRDGDTTIDRSCVFEERVAASKRRLVQGNEAFERGDLQEAMHAFVSGLWQVNFDEASYNFELRDIHRQEVDSCQTKLLLNLSTLVGKPRKTHQVFNPNLSKLCATELLRISKNKSLKGHMHLAQAHIQLNNSSAATESLDTVEKLISEAEDANVDDLSSKVQKLRDRVAKLHKAEVEARRSTWKGKFNKSAPKNDKEPSRDEVDQATEAATAAVKAALRQRRAEHKNEAAGSGTPQAPEDHKELKEIPASLKWTMEIVTFAVMAIVYYFFFS